MLAALAGVTSGISSSPKTPEQPEASTSAGPSSATVERRRSQRLSAKNAAAASEVAAESASEEAGPSNPPLGPLSSSAEVEPPASALGEESFGDNAEFTADFTDDDMEAEVRTSPITMSKTQTDEPHR